MPKVAVITDSNSGINQAEAARLGIRVVPMPFTINGEDYLEDINLTQEEFYEKLSEGADVKTTMPSPLTLIDLWNEVLNDYDEIVYIPMSSGLSGSMQAARVIAEDFDGRVEVVDNQRISVTQRMSALEAMALAEKGLSAKEIREQLEIHGLHSSIYIMVDTLHYLKKGGRLTPAVAAIGTLLHIKPVLQIQGERLDAFARARTVTQAKKIILAAIADDIETRFGGMENGKFEIAAAYTYDKEAAAEWKKEIEAHFPGHDIHMDPLSLSVACHIGPGAIAATVTEIMPV